MASVIALYGPTASGKSQLSLALSRELPVEIISVDSACVYRGMDIGTAKPSREERAMIPHHLIDIREPFEIYSAGEFVHDSLALIADIEARKRVPLLVGGTMMYFASLWQGIAEFPEVDDAIKQKIQQEGETLGWDVLHARLQEVDPLAASRIKPTDPQRIHRALAVFESSGEPWSSFWAQEGTKLDVPCLKVALTVETRSLLHNRIEERFKAMCEAGFVDEVRNLMATHELNPDLPAMRMVGYRQAWQYLSGELSYEKFVEESIAKTRGLAKRQLTWMRKLPADLTLQIDKLSVNQQVNQILEQFALQN